MAQSPAQKERDALKKVVAQRDATIADLLREKTTDTAIIADLRARLAAMGNPPVPPTPPVITPSADGAKVTPGKGELTNKAGVKAAINLLGQITLNDRVDASSNQVVSMKYDAKTDGFIQTNSSGQEWTEPANGGPGVWLNKPAEPAPPTPSPPVTSPPIVTGQASPVGGFKSRTFADDFKAGYRKNWQNWGPWGRNDANGRRFRSPTQPGISTDADYTPDLPNPCEDIAGGGVRLLTIKNPNVNHPKLQLENLEPTYLMSMIWTKAFQIKRGSYTAFDMTLSRDRGSYAAAWGYGAANHEIDGMEQLGIEPDRLFAGAVVQGVRGDGPFNPKEYKDYPRLGGEQHRYGWLWADDYIEWYLDDQLIGKRLAGTGSWLSNPLFLCANNTVGGFDHNNENISPRTEVIVHAVHSWA